MTFKLGDALAVKVGKADLESAKIDFVSVCPRLPQDAAELAPRKQAQQQETR